MMTLIYCPECKREISDKAKACPSCGYPLEELNLFDIDDPELEFPDFPNDLSIGQQNANWSGIEIIDGYYENSGNNDDNIQSGKLKIWLHEKGFSVRQGLITILFEINYLQIISAQELKIRDVIKDKSVIGRASLGYVIFGTLGAIIGGISGLGQKDRRALCINDYILEYGK
jgi:hypothetical protein